MHGFAPRAAFLLASLVGAGCGVRDATSPAAGPQPDGGAQPDGGEQGECSPGHVRECSDGDCSYLAGCDYSCGRGDCKYLAIGYTQSCSDGGQWIACDCPPVILDPDCAGVGGWAAQEQCSTFVRDLGYGMPAGLDAKACRWAALAYWKCGGGQPSTCAAEIAALDDACLGPDHPTCGAPSR